MIFESCFLLSHLVGKWLNMTKQNLFHIWHDICTWFGWNAFFCPTKEVEQKLGRWDKIGKLLIYPCQIRPLNLPPGWLVHFDMHVKWSFVLETRTFWFSFVKSIRHIVDYLDWNLNHDYYFIGYEGLWRTCALRGSIHSLLHKAGHTFVFKLHGNI